MHSIATDIAPRNASGVAGAASRYAWLVFAVTFGLLLSDYMSRQVLNAVFPQLKAEWLLSDARLGALSGVVSLAVGALALPLSLLADRWGRIRSLVLMAAMWSIATLACALARDYQQLLAARLLVGIGEAAYGSVGLALLLTLFPGRMRATISGAFLAGGMIGSVLGISLGGFIAAHFGWRAAFAGMAVFGIVLTICYPLVVKKGCLAAAANAAGPCRRPRLRTLVSSRSLVCAYLGSGVQLFISGALLAWLPSYLNRYYDMPIAQGALVAAMFVLTSAAGMAICGNVSDRVAHDWPALKLSLAIAYCVGSCALLSTAFSLPPGILQLILIGLGMFFGAGTVGPAGAMVANLTPAPLHGTAFATLSLANNLLGLAPAPIVTGLLADALGLSAALRLVPLVSLAAAGIFAIAKLSYHRDLQQVSRRAGSA